MKRKGGEGRGEVPHGSPTTVTGYTLCSTPGRGRDSKDAQSSIRDAQVQSETAEFIRDPDFNQMLRV